MRRGILSLTIILGLSLTACSDGGEERKSSEQSTTSSQKDDAAEKSSEKDGQGNDQLQLAEPFEISTLEDNDVYLTVKDISLGKECRFGVYAPDFTQDDLGEGKQYLQVLAEVNVEKLDNSMSQGFVYLDDPKFVDNEGFTADAPRALDCQEGEGYEDWLMPTAAADKSRRYGAFVIPKDVEEIRIHGKVFKVD